MEARHSVSCTLSPTHLLGLDVLEETLRGQLREEPPKPVSKRSKWDPAALTRGCVRDYCHHP